MLIKDSSHSSNCKLFELVIKLHFFFHFFFFFLFFYLPFCVFSRGETRKTLTRTCYRNNEDPRRIRLTWIFDSNEEINKKLHLKDVGKRDDTNEYFWIILIFSVNFDKLNILAFLDIWIYRIHFSNHLQLWIIRLEISESE